MGSCQKSLDVTSLCYLVDGSNHFPGYKTKYLWNHLGGEHSLGVLRDSLYEPIYALPSNSNYLDLNDCFIPIGFQLPLETQIRMKSFCFGAVNDMTLVLPCHLHEVNQSTSIIYMVYGKWIVLGCLHRTKTHERIGQQTFPCFWEAQTYPFWLVNFWRGPKHDIPGHQVPITETEPNMRLIMWFDQYVDVPGSW